MEKEQFYRLIENSDALDNNTIQSLENLVENYPYFQSARLLYTKNLHTVQSANFASELSKTAVFCADRRRLFYYINDSDYTQFLPQPEKEFGTEDRTQALLDSFLTSIEEEMESPAHVVTDPTLSVISTDYLSYLESLGEISPSEEENAHSLKHQDIIDNFIEKSETERLFSQTEKNSSKSSEDTDIEESKDEFLTETLARIYIKQKKYEQALTIIKRLSLNFPKKSAYFADQIRFLEHLILNEKYKK